MTEESQEHSNEEVDVEIRETYDDMSDYPYLSGILAVSGAAAAGHIYTSVMGGFAIAGPAG